MQTFSGWKLLAACCAVTSILGMGKAGAETIRLGLLPGGETIVRYEISVLRMALEFMPGDQTLEIVYLTNTPQQRMLYILEHGVGTSGSEGETLIDVVVTANSPERENRLLQVDVPVTRGLLGNRVLAVRSDWNDHNNLPCNLKELTETITIGSGVDWPDTDVFERAGFSVMRTSYTGLWRMLKGGRYDGFNRSIHEVRVDLAEQKAKGWNFEIAPNLVFSYRQDYFFYVHKDNRDLHARLTAALNAAYGAGAFMENFNADPEIQGALSILQQPNLCRIYLDSPFVTDRLSAIPEQYWE